MGEIGEGPSRKIYKGHMDKAKRGGFEGERCGWVGLGLRWGKKRHLYLHSN